MKKSGKVFLSAIMLTAIASCRQREQWVSGYDSGGTGRDTFVNRSHYRYYHGAWFPVFNNRINPGIYQGGSSNQIASPGYHSPVRTGGFGSSAHSSSVHS